MIYPEFVPEREIPHVRSIPVWMLTNKRVKWSRYSIKAVYRPSSYLPGSRLHGCMARTILLWSICILVASQPMHTFACADVVMGPLFGSMQIYDKTIDLIIFLRMAVKSDNKSREENVIFLKESLSYSKRVLILWSIFCCIFIKYDCHCIMQLAIYMWWTSQRKVRVDTAEDEKFTTLPCMYIPHL